MTSEIADSNSSPIVDRLYNDLPRVHVELGNPETGVWQTDRSCYEFIERHCDPQYHTLETGLGFSTALFALIGSWHTCVAPWKSEVERLHSYFKERNIATERLKVIRGFSDEVLPGLPRDELDLVLIDGEHGFPTPVIDWYYGAGRLRNGGLLVIDDVHLPAVRSLLGFLDADSRWKSVVAGKKWVAYERSTDGPLREAHTNQKFWDI